MDESVHTSDDIDIVILMPFTRDSIVLKEVL
jgi:hypothetical protein